MKQIAHEHIGLVLQYSRTKKLLDEFLPDYVVSFGSPVVLWIRPNNIDQVDSTKDNSLVEVLGDDTPSWTTCPASQSFPLTKILYASPQIADHCWPTVQMQWRDGVSNICLNPLQATERSSPFDNFLNRLAPVVDRKRSKRSTFLPGYKKSEM
ncbi:hypothetical protein NC653_018121 [Populus alba x Populus x berolinensis]|uniref:Uncharacterized protein n=1 Tax=Populus alba x Populus x berolinensis TaxID=444605 RepID=A0AAD6W1H5_9ROSI|nr:hypothetical protein NC653_018121 [Populus alba x Populus x berolinensis]